MHRERCASKVRTVTTKPHRKVNGRRNELEQNSARTERRNTTENLESRLTVHGTHKYGIYTDKSTHAKAKDGKEACAMCPWSDDS